MTLKSALLIAAISLPLSFTTALAQSTGAIISMTAKTVPAQGNTYVLVTITNQGTQILDQLNFKCVFTLDGEPVSVVTGYVQRLAPGKSDTVQVYANYQTPSDDYSCRAMQALIYF